MAPKRKNAVILSPVKRLAILQDLKTLPQKKVAAKYEVSQSTVWNISKEDELNRLKSLWGNGYRELDKHLHEWYKVRFKRQAYISDSLLIQAMQNLASVLRYKKIPDLEWLEIFKRRHNIQIGYGGKMYKMISQNVIMMDDERIDLENLYHIDETILLWKALPTEADEDDGGNYMKDCKLNNKEKIVICLCTNATETHIIKPLVIKNYKNSVGRTGQTYNATLTDEQETMARKNAGLFADWYKNHFKASSKRHQLENSLTGNVRLLLENCNYFGLKDEGESDEFKMVCSSRASPFRKRINQDLIDAMKTHYRHRLMKKFVRYYPNEEEFFRNHSIEDCLNMVMESWEDVLGLNTQSEPLHVPDKIRRELKTWRKSNITEMRDMMKVIINRRSVRDDVVRYLLECRIEEQNFVTENDEQSCGEISENEEESSGEINESEEKNSGEISESEEESTGEINENKEERSGEINKNVEERSGEINENVEERSGEINENIEERSGEINENVEENGEESDHEEPPLVIDESANEDRGEINENENEESSTEEANDQSREAGIQLNSEEREEMEYVFKRLEYYYPRMPRATELDLQACKSAFLGEPK